MALALGSFLVTISAVQRVSVIYDRASIPHSELGFFSDKFYLFQSTKDDYDAVVIGTSQAYRGLDPRIFDGIVGKEIANFKSFNFSYESLNLTELNIILDFVRDQKPKKLKYVFFEPLNTPNIFFHNLATERTVQTHNWKYSLLALEQTLRSQVLPRDRFDIFRWHLQSLIHYVTGTGVFLRMQSKWLKPRQDRAATYAQTRGFFPMDDETDPSFHNLKIALDEPSDVVEYRQELEEEMNRRRSPASVKAHGSFENMMQVISDVKSAGYQPVIFVPPDLYDPYYLEEVYDRLESKLDVPVFMYADPEKFPELYSPEHRFGRVHLNKKGAELFSEMFARDFLKSVDSTRR